MTTQQIASYFGWGLLLIIIAGAIWLAYAMYKDYKNRSDEDIALPSLNQEDERNDSEFFEEAKGQALADAQTKTLTRKQRRELQEKGSAVPTEGRSSSFFDDDETFELPSGRD